MSRDQTLARMGGDDTLCVDCGQPSFAAPAGRCYVCAQKASAIATRIPPEALAAVERVLAFRAAAVDEVPGQERWRSTTVEHQAAKAGSHSLEAIQGTEADHETGEHPLAHAAARALLGLALALRDKQ